MAIDSMQKVIGEIRDQGFCVLRGHLPSRLVDACRDAFWPRLLAYLESGQASNRGPYRHCLAMPFERHGASCAFRSGSERHMIAHSRPIPLPAQEDP
jgi:hypothetical protein